MSGAADKERPVSEIIAAACERERAGQSHGEVGPAIRRIVEARRKSVALEYARGDIAAERLARTIEEVIGALFSAGAALHPAARKLAVVAVGGFGRRLLAPHSDVDLLFLHDGDATAIRPLVDFMLYPLWDAGLKVGHAAHPPREAVRAAERDMTARTAWLDARLLHGESRVFRDFRQAYENLRKRTKKQFIAAKEDERAARHARAETGRYLAEPDLKEGKGGLRDLHFMRWVWKYAHETDIADPKGRKRAFSAEDIAAFRQAERFLWSVRVQLHALRGRAEEKLSFDLQPVLAERLGFNDRGDMTAAERLMRRYFMNAMEVGRLLRILTARLEEEREIARLSPAAIRTLPKALGRDEAGEGPNLRLHVGRLHFQNPARARKNPIDSFRLFRAYARRPDFAFHPEALAVVAASVRNVTAETRDDPKIAELFVSSLTEAKDPVRLLRVMAETGLLGAYLRAFGKIIGRTEYGLYRRYSIDETAYRAIGVLHEIIRGEASEKHPIASRILAAAPDRRRYFIALLLHEIGWGMKEAGIDAVERDIARIARRLGLGDDEARLVGWAGARHRLMQETVERRDLSEPASVRRFAEEVATRERLDLLLVLAVCHQRVVAANSWDDWTRRQISMLYDSARAYLEGGEEGLILRREASAEEARAEASAHLSARSGGERARQLDRLPTAVLKTAEPELIGRIADLVSAAENEGATAAVSARLRDGLIEAIVYAADRTGLLADLAGAVAAAGASVRSVQVTTSEDGKAIDVFAAQAVDGAIPDAELARRLHAKLLEAAQRAPARPPSFSRRIGDRRAMFHVPAKIRLDAEASASSLIVEAEGRDRPGLLYDLCAAFADLGLTIASAHVATYGARAVDAFYVRDGKGRKPADPARLAAIEARLRAALDGGEGARTPLTPKP
ncbi:MAG: [protein-PII] uridylyltransferase [Parvularculaceae bacterium]|nr:[protein-PII] uridylyltransferase [Parvularculaceae bacterium]